MRTYGKYAPVRSTVVFGGVGSLAGTLIAAFGLGVINKMLEPWAGAVLAKVFGFLALVMASVNIFGGFLVTRRMLEMFKKKEPKGVKK